MTSSSQPALGAIRLAWWREALERLDTGPAAARTAAAGGGRRAAAARSPGTELAGLEDGWATLLDEEPDIERVGRTRRKAVRHWRPAAWRVRSSWLIVAGRLYAYRSVFRRGPVPAALADGGNAPAPSSPLPAPLAAADRPGPACGARRRPAAEHGARSHAGAGRGADYPPAVRARGLRFRRPSWAAAHRAKPRPDGRAGSASGGQAAAIVTI